MSIKEKLRHGDVIVIAEISGLSKTHIYKVLDGKRKSKKVELVAQRLISTRENLIRETGGKRRQKAN